jgi:hypothetical protein
MCNYRLCVQQIGFLAKSEIQWKRPHIVSHDWLLQELKILIRISEQAIGVYTTVESTVQQVRYILLLYFLYGIV